MKKLLAILLGSLALAAPAEPYAWRGFMLDEARHFFGKKVVKQYLDRMVEMKLNVFHWHLVDDQGWRLEIPSMPELIQYGAKRPSTPTPPGNETSDHTPYGPYFYTEDDVKEILAYAQARGIQVVPEIEMPGHVRAMLAAHPEFACEGRKFDRTPWTCFGVCKDVMCAGNDEALAYYKRILDEVMALFPSSFIHIGGDECPKDAWKTCPKCQAKKAALGLADEDALQAWMTTEVAKYLESKGRRAITWQLTSTNLPRSVIIQSWEGVKEGTKAAELGHDVIMSPFEWTYFTLAEGLPGDPYAYRSWVKGMQLSAEKMGRFDPVAGIPPKDRKHILGSECCAWSEYIWTPAELEYKTLHRMPSFASALQRQP